MITEGTPSNRLGHVMSGMNVDRDLRCFLAANITDSTVALLNTRDSIPPSDHSPEITCCLDVLSADAIIYSSTFLCNKKNTSLTSSMQVEISGIKSD